MAVSESLVYRILADNKQFKKKLAESQKKLRGYHRRTSSITREIKSTIARTFAVGGIVAFGKSVIDTTANFQKLQAVLTNTLGSGSEAEKAMQMISDFASKTPFQVDGLTGSFVKLANQGFTPTSNEMRKLGDLAASTGKDFDQLAEALIDAQVGEFERLKEFGIRASKQGDQVKFTFKGVEQQIKFTDQSIRDYVLSLGDANGVSGSMAAISETVGGKISNLNDKFTQLKNTIGNQSEGVIAGVLNFSNTLLEGFNRLAEGNLFNDDPFLLGERIAKNLQIANEDLEKEVSKMQSKLQEMRAKVVEIADFLGREDLSVTRAVKLKEVQEALFGQIQKYVGILSVLNPKLNDYNKSTEEARKKTLELKDALKALKQEQINSTLSDRQSLGTDSINMTAEVRSPLGMGNAAALYEQQLAAIQEKHRAFIDEMTALNEHLAMVITGTLDAAFNTIIDGIATGDLENAFNNLKAVFGQGLIEAGKALIGWGKLMEGIKAALESGIFGGVGAIVVGGLAIAAGVALKASAARANSGISSGLGGSGGGSGRGFSNNITGQTVNFNATPKPIKVEFVNGSLTGMLEFEKKRLGRTG